MSTHMKTIVCFCFLASIAMCQTLDFSQCIDTYAKNSSCIDNCTTQYYYVQVCSPARPTIDASVVLDANHTLAIWPAYNLSVKIADSVFSDQITRAMQDLETIQSFDGKVKAINDSATASANGLIETQKTLGIFNARILVLESSGGNTTTDLNSRLTAIENKMRNDNGSGWMTAAFVIIVFVLIGGAYFAFKTGMIKPPYSKESPWNRLSMEMAKLRNEPSAKSSIDEQAEVLAKAAAKMAAHRKKSARD